MIQHAVLRSHNERGVMDLSIIGTFEEEKKICSIFQVGKQSSSSMYNNILYRLKILRTL